MYLAIFFVVLVCTSLIGVQVWLTAHARSVQLNESEIAAANLAEAVGQHAYDTIKEADTVLVGLVERLENDGKLELELDRFHQLLVHRVAELPQLHGLFVYGDDGRWLVNSQPELLKGKNNSDREYFIYHREHADRGVHIGPPVRSKSTGDWIVTVSRRFNQPDGSFGGVVLAAINMNYFQKFFERFKIGEDGAIQLALDDGIMLVRRPFNEKSLGRDISKLPLFHDYLPKAPVDTVIFTSAQDGVTRINSYRRLEQYPLVVSAALSKDEVLAQWRADAYLYSAGVIILVLGISLLGIRLVRQINLRIQAEAELVRARNSLVTLNQTLERLAMQDGMTGLSNRRHFDATLKNEFSRAMRGASALALVMIDVDSFKQYNDIFGHAAGDECLKAISKVVADSKHRPGDIAARYGGEELAVLLPGTDVAGALAVAEHIRAAVEDLNIKHPGSATGYVTVSAGVESFAPVRFESEPVDLIKAADQALYRAKSLGRNRVHSNIIDREVRSASALGVAG
ncbi:MULTISPECIES: sensor domain-containing diguanylate cyclase [unclassified Duganella]|uniref:sensor domain-containing diguanylate cyclase n=1 Tax=unclassified Duganella TaxID=2636909 RepID=UPI000E3411F3|nr:MULTISPECIES: sensor domain-containing diguanylate cyclase [unclassified Duganella]RFP09972.1 GGDEF domain-containing protein [Duganella sp. BJB475]RFP25723.1 GGDEF domain-containing protein [Duganella sp. BJB476]